MNTIETTATLRTSAQQRPRRDASNLDQLGSQREVREKGVRTKNADEDELYENVPCTD